MVLVHVMSYSQFFNICRFYLLGLLVRLSAAKIEPEKHVFESIMPKSAVKDLLSIGMTFSEVSRVPGVSLVRGTESTLNWRSIFQVRIHDAHERG